MKKKVYYFIMKFKDVCFRKDNSSMKRLELVPLSCKVLIRCSSFRMYKNGKTVIRNAELLDFRGDKMIEFSDNFQRYKHILGFEQKSFQFYLSTLTKVLTSSSDKIYEDMSEEEVRLLFEIED